MDRGVQPKPVFAGMLAWLGRPLWILSPWAWAKGGAGTHCLPRGGAASIADCI